MFATHSRQLTLPVEQQEIQDSCFHSEGEFTPFSQEDINQSLPERFEKQVRKYPDRVAIKTKNRQLSYLELNEAANQVANTLLAQHGKRTEAVALLLAHGAKPLIAILGVLKAGRFYVVLDITHPSSRNIHLLEDSQSDLIITDSNNVSLATDLAQKGQRIINIDAIDAGTSRSNPNLSIPPDAFSCILYTSGSTAEPKGVVHRHFDMQHMARNHINSYHICSEDRVGLIFSCGAIGGSRDFLGALLQGASLYPFNARNEGIASLADWLVQEEITSFRIPVSLFRQFDKVLTGKESFAKVRLMHIGTESIFAQDLEMYKRYFSPSCVFTVGLGSTEISPMRIFLANHQTRITTTSIPAGYPVEGVEVMLLDEAGEPVAPGEIGQIAVKSRYLALGYWKNAELTRSKFLGDPEGGEERIYLTGDLGKLLPDGCLVHLGRIDSQVKIRGYNVLLKELEASLLDLEAVKEAAVIARQNASGDNRLEAYVVPAVEPPPTSGQLVQALLRTLPHYMIPAVFVMLDALPSLPNGKVDRHSLRAPGLDNSKSDTPILEHKTPLEGTLAAIWQEVLGLDRIDSHDNFLDLGGNSLAAMKVAVSVKRTTGATVKPQEVLTQTVGQLASTCEFRMRNGGSFNFPIRMIRTIYRSFLQKTGKYGKSSPS